MRKATLGIHSSFNFSTVLKVALTYILLSPLFTNAFSQESSSKVSVITGKVVDESNAPVPYATVGLYSSTDSAFVDGALTDDAGAFNLKPRKNGIHYLKISFLSFAEKTIDKIDFTGQTLDLGTITLTAEAVTLDEVQVTGEKSQLQFDLDKRVYNVAKDLTAKGGSAIDVLENVPSVSVDVDGNVSLRGSEQVNILVDGKPSGLIGVSTSDALRQLQGSLIERIEVITNPSARYNAEGESGIINIVLNKNQKKGVNGSFEVGTGWPHNHSAAYNLNYRRNWINLFSNYSVHYRRFPGYGFIEQTNDAADEAFYRYTSNRNHDRGGLGNTIRVGTDFFIKDNNTLTVSGLYRYSKGQNEGLIDYTDFDIFENIVLESRREDIEIETKSTGELELNYDKVFKSNDDHNLSANFKFFRSNDNEENEILEFSSNETISDQIIDNKEYEQSFALQVDYILPFKENYKFEAGSQNTFRTIENNYQVQQKDDDGNYQILPNFDNLFIYTENIYAAYAIIGGNNKPFSWQTGLRFEYSDIGTVLVKTNEANKRKNPNFFPSAHFSYEFLKQNTFQLGYSRRITRPRFWSLIPFVGFTDSRNFYKGNPDLLPTFSHSVELGYLKTLDKVTFLGSIYYRHTTDGVERIVLESAENPDITEFSPINLSTINSYGIEFNTSYTPFESWKLTANGNFFRFISDGEYLGVSYDVESYSFIGQLSSKNTFFKKLDIQNTFIFHSPEKTLQGKQKARFSWNVGASMDIIQGNGSIIFSGRDILNTFVRRSIIDTDMIQGISEFQWRSRQFLLTFTYRLNQSKAEASKKRMNE